MFTATSVGMTAKPAPVARRRLRTLAGFATRPLEVLTELAREYGDVVRLGFGGYCLITHPEHVKHVLEDNYDNYWKGRTMLRRSGGLFGEGLVANDGDWRHQRRVILPVLSPRAAHAQVPLIVDETLRAIERWQGYAGPFGLKAELRALTQSVIVRILMGQDLGRWARSLGQAMCDIGHYVGGSMRAPIFVPPSVPTPGNLRFRRAVRALDRALLELRSGGGGDLLSVLRASGASEKRVRDELVTMFVAGHETAASTLTWTLVCLSKNSAVRRRLAEEVFRVLGEREPGAPDLDRLEYMERVLKEVLRLYPPAWVFVREPYANDCIGGYRIPAGASVLLCPYLTHRRTELWPDPECFDPERFASGRIQGLPKFAWYPFGGGPRICLGQPFAFTQMKVMLALWAQHFPLTLEPGPPLKPDPRLTLEPRGELRVSLAPEGW